MYFFNKQVKTKLKMIKQGSKDTTFFVNIINEWWENICYREIWFATGNTVWLEFLYEKDVKFELPIREISTLQILNKLVACTCTFLLYATDLPSEVSSIKDILRRND